MLKKIFPIGLILVGMTLITGDVIQAGQAEIDEVLNRELLVATQRQSNPLAGELVIFNSKAESFISTDFRNKALPEILAFAKTQGMVVTLKELEKGAPEEVQLTPLIVFQNYRGRSIYTGRYSQTSKLKNFVRTVRRLPQGESENIKKAVFIRKVGKTILASPFKVTPVSGEIPEGFDQEAFHQTAIEGLSAGMEAYELKHNFDLPKTSRSFYLSLYPHAGKGGKLSLSMEIYSQFSCVDPVFVAFEDPLTGKLKKSQALFAEAGKILKKEIDQLVSGSLIGDGFDPVPGNNPEKSWEELGLKLPAPPLVALPGDVGEIPLALNWTLDGPVDRLTPLLQFQFLPPLDHYAGEVKKLSGNLKLSPGLSLQQAKGQFEVETASVDMGDEMLNTEIYEKYIKVYEFPVSSFQFLEILSGGKEPLSFGSLSQIKVKGEFKLKGFSIPLIVDAQIQPVLSDKEEARLEVSASFRLRLKDPFGIDGPDGPDPSNDTMVMYLNFLMKPA